MFFFKPFFVFDLFPLQTFPSLSTPPQTKDWSSASVVSELTSGVILRTVNHLMENFQEEMRKLPEVCKSSFRPPVKLRGLKTRTSTKTQIYDGHQRWIPKFYLLKCTILQQYLHMCYYGNGNKYCIYFVVEALICLIWSFDDHMFTDKGSTVQDPNSTAVLFPH